MSRRVFSGIVPVFLAGLFLVASSSLALAATIPVTITGTGFIPAQLTVTAGDTLEFRNSTTATQSAKTSLASGFNTGDIGANMTKSVSVSNPGTYTYSSAYNAALVGTVTVNNSSSSASTSTKVSTTSAVLNTQPVNSQPQPVSGVFEVVLAMGLTGVLLVAGGWTWQVRLARAEFAQEQEAAGHTAIKLTDLPALTLRRLTETNPEE